jgi:hypothetical protein
MSPTCDSSTKKVLLPAARSSAAPMRVKTPSKMHSSADAAGT